MRISHEDTTRLLTLVRENETVFDDCYRVTMQAVADNPSLGSAEEGARKMSMRTRAELATTLKSVIRYSGDTAIEDHLGSASVDWGELTRRLLADVLQEVAKD